MKRPAFGLVIVGWLCAAGAAFLALLERDATDDYAGWIPAVVALQLPALFALASGASGTPGASGPPGAAGEPPPPPLSAARRWALIVPATLAAAAAAFWAAGAVGAMIWAPELAEVRPLLLALAAGIAALIAGPIAFARILREAPHRRGVRRVLLGVTAAAAAGVAAPLLLFARARRSDDPAAWLAIGAPALWVLPLWLALAVEPAPPPRIPRVIVR